MNGDIDKLIKFIEKHFVFDEDTYPGLKGKTKDEQLVFMINHLALHFSKTAGKITAVSERVDHGEVLDTEEIKKNVPKAVINALCLANLVGMTEKDIISAIEVKYNDRLT